MRHFIISKPQINGKSSWSRISQIMNQSETPMNGHVMTYGNSYQLMKDGNELQVTKQRLLDSLIGALSGD